MQVYKFGGASVRDAHGVKNITKIVADNNIEPLLVVVSAMGKTTNLLEKLLDAYFYQTCEKEQLFEQVKQEHELLIKELFLQQASEALSPIKDLLNQLLTVLQEPVSENYDYHYDRIVSFGELLSTTIVATYFKAEGIPSKWYDARRIICTDNTYREGRVDWKRTQKRVKTILLPLYEQNKNQIIVTQGFIGGTTEGLTTTLGREGSDFSAAVLAFSLDATKVTIWKDVDGLLNADPKFFPGTVKLDKIPYREAIELAFYGASVIHPKTLKPLQNKNIPLFVKSFLKPEAEGSVIGDFSSEKMVPCYICKKNQVLISIMPKDFSFIAEENLSTIFALFAYFGVKINLMQNSALSFSLCVDDRNSISNLIEELKTEFFVKYNSNMELFTIRHYDKKSIETITQDREVLLEQRNRTTVQFVLRKMEQ